MKHSQNDQIEQQLTHQLRQAEAPYRRALAVIQASVPETGSDVEDVSKCLTRLEPLMRQVQSLEAVLAPLRQQWLALARQPGAELRQVLQQHEQLLGRLIGRINVLETQLQSQRREVIPSVDSYVRHQQMQRAYQQLSK